MNRRALPSASARWTSAAHAATRSLARRATCANATASIDHASVSSHPSNARAVRYATVARPTESSRSRHSGCPSSAKRAETRQAAATATRLSAAAVESPDPSTRLAGEASPASAVTNARPTWTPSPSCARVASAIGRRIRRRIAAKATPAPAHPSTSEGPLTSRARATSARTTPITSARSSISCEIRLLDAPANPTARWTRARATSHAFASGVPPAANRKPYPASASTSAFAQSRKLDDGLSPAAGRRSS